jgi:hypothetical protein
LQSVEVSRGYFPGRLCRSFPTERPRLSTQTLRKRVICQGEAGTCPSIPCPGGGRPATPREPQREGPPARPCDRGCQSKNAGPHAGPEGVTYFFERWSRDGYGTRDTPSFWTGNRGTGSEASVGDRSLKKRGARHSRTSGGGACPKSEDPTAALRGYLTLRRGGCLLSFSRPGFGFVRRETPENRPETGPKRGG